MSLSVLDNVTFALINDIESQVGTYSISVTGEVSNLITKVENNLTSMVKFLKDKLLINY